MGGNGKHTHGSTGEAKTKSDRKSAYSNPQQALLVGLVHLLGLFFTHSRSSFKARATSVLFDQLLSHLNILEKSAGNDGVIIIRRAGRRFLTKRGSPNYHISLGPLTLKGKGRVIDLSSTGNGPMMRMDAALGQSFECLSTHGIDSLLMEFPGSSTDKVDKLRLSLNIIARYRVAVENSATIVFRYYGRSMRVPLVHDYLGRPDPNLTLMAGLNGISARNARELVRQADAYHDLAPADDSDPPKNTIANQSSYERIFRKASLKSQLIKPLVEINTLPWVVDDKAKAKEGNKPPAPQDQNCIPIGDDAVIASVDPRFAWRSFSVYRFREPVSYSLLSGLLDIRNSQIASAVDAVLADDYNSLDIKEAGRRLVMATTVLRAVEKQSRDPLIIDRLIHHLHDQFLWVPDTVLTNITVQKKGIKLFDQSGAIMVGMIHPRLLDS